MKRILMKTRSIPSPALAFEMLCNGAGVDAMAVTSTSHEWNKVRIEDSWYNVDVTWDDDTSSYAYFERNDTYYDTESAYSASNHREEAFWEDYLPLCSGGIADDYCCDGYTGDYSE